MSKLFPSALLVAGLCTPILAQAQNGMEWRRSGSDTYYRHIGEKQWHQAPGSVSNQGDGWVIGNDALDGGYGIYRWNGNDWDPMPGSAVKVGGSYFNPWIINDRGERFTWRGHDWVPDANYDRKKPWRQ